MDPALAALDFAKAGAILADMVVSYLAAGAPPSNPEGPDDHDLQDRRSTPVAASVHLHPPVDAGAGPLQSGEHRPPIQSDEQGPIARMEPGTDPGSRPRSRPVWRRSQQPRGLQDPGRRCGNGPGWRDLLPGSVAAGAIEPGLASPSRTVR